MIVRGANVKWELNGGNACRAKKVKESEGGYSVHPGKALAIVKSGVKGGTG